MERVFPTKITVTLLYKALWIQEFFVTSSAFVDEQYPMQMPHPRLVRRATRALLFS